MMKASLALLLAATAGQEASNVLAAEVIGRPANGCIVGAEALPLAGEGFQVVHSARQRYFAHPALLRVVRALGRQAVESGWGILLIGDLSQVRGGPMAYGHGSHQTGLDADVFFYLPERLLPEDEAENPPLAEVVTQDGKTVDGALWRPRIGALLEAAARMPEVERIFVHPAIKRALCLTRPGAWLHKLRPWWGHTEHFHLRLACPADSPECLAAAPIPPGEGCGAELDWWFTPAAAKPPAPSAQKPPLPPRCVGWLAEGQDGGKNMIKP
ncbi:MAG: penicillin-insensitive murein endopeptidase [Sulfuricellaceae bacterium]